MQTFDEQKAFFDGHWGAMKEAVESGGADAVVSFIDGIGDDLGRRVLYMFARQGLAMDEWEGKSFAPYVEVVDAGIAEMLRQADAADDEETKAARRNGAHILSFNLAADLADCWPGDEEPRTAADFERGLKAADDCIGWCRPELSHGLANDWWVRGIHLISLRRFTEAAESFAKSAEHAAKAAREAEKPTTVSPDGPFGVILATGFQGLAREFAGDEGGAAQYEEAAGAFRAQLEDEEKKGDAEFGQSQFDTVRERYGT